MRNAVIIIVIFFSFIFYIQYTKMQEMQSCIAKIESQDFPPERPKWIPTIPHIEIKPAEPPVDKPKSEIGLPASAMTIPMAKCYFYRDGKVHDYAEPEFGGKEIRLKNMYFHCTVLSSITYGGKVYYFIKLTEPGYTPDIRLLMEADVFFTK